MTYFHLLRQVWVLEAFNPKTKEKIIMGVFKKYKQATRYKELVLYKDIYRDWQLTVYTAELNPSITAFWIYSDILQGNQGTPAQDKASDALDTSGEIAQEPKKKGKKS